MAACGPGEPEAAAVALPTLDVRQRRHIGLNDPPRRALQQNLDLQPAAMFYTDDVKADYERIKARGANFTMPPTEVTGSTITMLDDTCGNLMQLTQLSWQG